MVTKLRVLLLWIFTLSGQLHAQRCGYDYLQEFVIKGMRDGDTQKIEKLTLNLSDTVEVRIPPSFSEKPTPVNVDARNFQFQVLRDRAVVKNATIWSINNGEKRNIDYVESGDFQVVWLPQGIDTLFFEKEGSHNFLIGINKEFGQSMYMVELFDWTRSNCFLRQYPEFRTYQGYRFVDTVFLVKMPNNNPELFSKRLQTMQQELSVIKEARYDAQYYTVSFNIRDVDRAKKIMRGWLVKGWIESAHQGLVIASGYGEAITFLSGEITLKPINHQWLAEYQKWSDSAGFRLFHSFGDGTITLASTERLIDAEVFYKQLKFSEDKRWKYSNPGFFNPLKLELEGYR